MYAKNFSLRFALFSSVVGLGAALAGCQQSPTTNPSTDLAATHTDLGTQVDLAPVAPKGVYILSNDATDNRLYAYARAADGTLNSGTSYSTGGKGSGMPLASQGALAFDATQSRFFAVNAGDNTVSMLSLKADGTVALQSVVSSGGTDPVSVTVSGNYVYVVNAGSANAAANIAGFMITGSSLSPIQNSKQVLSSFTAGPGEILFVANGAYLAVTEKMTNKIDIYPVTAGVAGTAMTQSASGPTPYGFALSANQQLIVSEAGAGVANAGSASSYSLGASGALTAISVKVPSGQTAPCWVAIAGNNAYMANTGTNNITGYTVSAAGVLTLLTAGVSGMTGMGPTDVDVTDGNDFLYVLDSKDHAFSSYGINADGSLTKKTDYTGLPAAAIGLIAR